MTEQEKEIQRRIRIDLYSPAELAIYNAMLEVEKAGVSVHLTHAVIKLVEAKNHVADFIDGVPIKEFHEVKETEKQDMVDHGAYPLKIKPVEEDKYKDCGAPINEGEAKIFTVCDKCWDKAYILKGVEKENWVNKIWCDAVEEKPKETFKFD